ncbi:hypothetical protein GN244_ATG09199 [Phytophthora infestans]|uniref:Uncharacterized protein n=1 Tax=Phytophthora infestans TaxID=4787 RepID=A0A833SBF9_PHYIN|nr:hypothetical protein GN244_ATG09199 [Phytophthora infestans]
MQERKAAKEARRAAKAAQKATKTEAITRKETEEIPIAERRPNPNRNPRLSSRLPPPLLTLLLLLAMFSVSETRVVVSTASSCAM